MDEPMSSTMPNDNDDERDEALIPCDVCFEHVRAYEYEAHTRFCALRHAIPPFMMVRDEDDNTVYRLNVAQAFDAMDAAMRSMANVATAAAPGAARNHARARDEIGSSEDEDDGQVEAEIPVARTHAAFPRLVLQTLSTAMDMDGIFAEIPADFMGRVYVGLSKDQLAQVLAKPQAQKQAGSVYCTICCEDVDADVSVQTLCRHTFCEACITKWLGMSKKCPMCMVDFEDELERRANYKNLHKSNAPNT